MPNVVLQAIMFVGTLVMEALPVLEVVFGIGAGTTAVVGALAITAGVVGMSKLMEMSLPRPDSNYARQKTVRTTTAPVKRVYGESLISGPVAFMGVSGTGNQDLWHVIALTGDKSESITDIYLDNVIIPNADINSGNALGGAVNGTTTIFKPIDSNTLVTVYKYLGGQTAASNPVDSEFFKWTSDHKGQGLTYIATKFSFPDNEKIAEIWNKYNPQDIKALVKGMAVYDPRKDSTSDEYDSSLGVSTQRLADSTTWQWSDNPALCLANYILDDDFGMGVSSSLIDWSAVHVAADYADALVSIPGSQTQKRFTCNGVLYGTDSHSQNINKILSSMNGSLVYSSGKYVMQAGQYIAPESDAILTDDDLTGPINITVANTRDSRFNTIKGTHFNPLDLHKKVAFPEVQLTDIATRDAGEVLYKEVELPMTNDVYMCQRLTYQMINRSNDQMLIEFPCNLKALRYTVGDRVKITLDKFAGSDSDSISFNETPFVILGFNFSAEGGVTLTLLKDTQANYTDMPVGNYSSIASDGSITDGFSGVPAPTNLGSVVNGHDVRLTWDNPVPNSTFNDIIVYQSDTSNFSDSSIFLRTKSDAVTFVLPSTGTTKYYWVRASLYDNEVAATDIIIGQTYRIRTLGNTSWTSLGASAPVNNGDTFVATASGTSSSGTGVATDESAVSAVVGPETVTTTDQVADSVEWVDVDDTDGFRPSNNATVGATLGTNVYDGQAQAYAVGDLLNSNGFFRFTRTSADDDVSAPADASAFNTAFGRNPTDGDIVVVTNTASTPDKQAAYQYNGSTFATISGFFAGDLIIDDTITAAALSVTELGAITADLGTITGGTLKGGDVPDADAAPSGSESGSFFDLDGGKFVVGDATNNLLFDGSSLSVTGDITASSGSFTGSVSVSNTGSMYGGTMSSFNTGAGFFLGYDTDAYKLSVGDASGEVLTWDGSKLNVEANTVSFSTGGEQDYSSESRYTTSQKSATVVLANNSSYFLFDNRRQDLAFPDFIVSYYLGPLTSGTQSSQANARNGIMDSIQVELFYADASTGSPGTWTSFRSITADSWYTDTGTNYVFSNFRVKDSGSYVASLDTRNGILDDYPTMSPFGDDIDGTSVPVGLVDNDYFINIPISRNTVVFPRGRYFIKVVITVTDGSLSPYPSTGSPTATERRVSIPNASSFVHPDFGQAVFVGGAHTTIFTDNNRDNETLIKGGSVYLMSKQGANADDSDSTAIFFGGRGTTGGTPNSAYGPLHGLYFFNDRDSIGSGSGILGSIGNPNFAMYVPYDGSKLTFEGDANFLNGLYINGVAVNAGAVTGPAGSDTQVQYNDGGSLGASSNFTFNDSTNTLTVQNLTVSGTTTTVNTDDLTVADKDITLNYSSGDSSSTANNAGIIIQDAVDASTDASILWKTASDSFEFSHAISTKNATFDNGTNTTVDVIADDDGMAQIRLYGSAQGTGRLFVGQSTNYGGGIEYNGDNSPSTTGAGADYIALFRNTGGTLAWTARNYYDSNNWEFRGEITANSALNLQSAGGVAGIYFQDTSGESTSTAFRLHSDVDATTVNIDTGGSQTIAAFVNNGNLLITGTIFADGAASNSLQWETGYDYSQIGHLPLAGGTLTDALNGTTINAFSAIGASDDIRTGLSHSDTTDMAAGVGGQLVLGYKYTTSGSITQGAIIKTYKENATNNHYGSGLKFQVRNTGVALSTKMTLDPSGNLSTVGSLTSNGILSNDIVRSKRDIRSAGQIRATGWYNEAADTNYTDLGFEIGVSSSEAFALSYDRVNNAYGPMQFNATQFTFNNKIKIGSTTFVDSSRNVTASSLTVSGNIQQNYAAEIRGKDSGGTVRTMLRISSDTYQIGWSGAGDVEFMGGGSYTKRMGIDGSTGNVSVTTSMTSTKAQHTTATSTNAHFRVLPSATTDTTGLSSVFLATSTVDGYGVSVNGARKGTDGTPTFTIRTHNNSTTGVEVLTISNAGSLATNGTIRANSTGVNTHASVSATWTSGVGMFMDYHPNLATGYIDNTYDRSATQSYGDIEIRQKVSGTMTTRLLFDNSDQSAKFYVPIRMESGNVIYSYTTAGNLRGYIKAVESDASTNAGLVIATSGGEAITFKDNGLSGTRNVEITGGGHLNLFHSLLANGTEVLSPSRNLVNIGTITSGVIDAYSAIGASDDVRTGIQHFDTTAMAAGVGGQIVLGYKYSGNTYTQGAIIKMYKENAVDGQYGSGLKFQVRNHGANLSTKMTLDPSGILSAYNVISGHQSYTPTGSIIGGLRAYGGNNAYVSASDESGRTAFFGVDNSGYAMFGALTNHDTVIRANNTEYLRVKTNANVQVVSGALQMGSTTVITSSRNLTNIGTYNGYAPSQSATSSHLNSIFSADTRSVNNTPTSRPRGLYVDFKTQSVIGLTGSGTYAGVLTFRSYGSSTDLSGGPPIQIAYDNAGSLQTRVGNGASAWHSWKVIHLAGNSLGASSIYASDTVRTQRGIYSAGQVRANGWYNEAADTNYTGLAFEIGVSGGQAFALSYNRDTSSYGPMQFNATQFTFNTTIYCAAIISSGTISSKSPIGPSDNVRTGLEHYDTTAMAAGVGGQLTLGYKYIAGSSTYTQGAIIRMYKENGTSGQYGSGLKFQVRNTGYDLSTKLTLDPSGNLTSTGNMTAYSDERLKDNIETLDGSKVLQMRGVSFTKNGEAGSGVIAQELELIASELVHTGDDEMGTKSVAYGNLVGYLIENAKQQQAEIDELKSLIKTLLEK